MSPRSYVFLAPWATVGQLSLGSLLVRGPAYPHLFPPLVFCLVHSLTRAKDRSDSLILRAERGFPALLARFADPNTSGGSSSRP